MGVVSVNQAVDGSTAVNAASLNTNFNTLANAINGNLDANNLAAGAVTLPKMATGVLANSNLSNPYKFSVYRNAALNSPNNTTAILTFDTKTYDTGTNIDVVTNKGRFTAPVAGFYSFSARAEVQTGGANSNLYISLYKNGAELHRGYQLTTTTLALTSVVAPPPVSLAANDYVEIYIYTSAVLALTVTSAIYNYFGGFLVSAT